MNTPSAGSSIAEYYDLGSFHRKITTTSPDAQLWFSRGLTWSYAFNHEEAVSCFEKAIEADPQCAMAYWGLAYALGPNYNKPWEVFDGDELQSTLSRAHDAAVKAKETVEATTASPIEQALTAAVQHRYPSTHVKNTDPVRWNASYATEMSKVYTSFPNDLDVAALYADALMNLTPWALWSIHSGLPSPDSHTLEAKSILERALAHPNALSHSGLLHLYIHLMEMSPTPEAALPFANALRDLVPDAGHLQHMPTHIDILCGDYEAAIASNTAAIAADEKFAARAGPLNFYTLYRAHNFHFRIYAAMFAGRSAVALETVEWLEAAITEGLLEVKTPPMADWLEGFLSVRVHVLVRFGRWEDLFALESPVDGELYCVTTAMIHYGKGVAFAVTGNIREAEDQRRLFTAAVKRVPESRTLFNNKCVDILAIAAAMLDGELENRRGNIDAGFSHLKKATELDDNLPYDEPWGWMQPTRHAYGALLLEQGRVEEAAAVYRADLGIDETLPRALRHLNNVWALQGYHECLVRLGRDEEARELEAQLRLAVAGADVPISSSCFCRVMESG
ncbi:hypothetical protein LSUE1_G009334 [Lachnellula suecica]|uniref:TPR domain protein n=1 Tax=Lachnellula suecica TaxID=602035 RepID=A0A8T9C013_9HELO|nr:hypothetical protein LSUE1_G009334 [Lachnellula suecica]